MLKKVTSRLTEEKYNYLKNGEGIAEGIRQAVELYSRQYKFHMEFYRHSTSGYAYFDVYAHNLEDAMDQAQHFKYVLNQKENLKDNFWYLKEIKQLN